MATGGCAVVLYDEVSSDALADEQDVLVQVEHVSRALKALGHQVVSLPMDRDPYSATRSLQELGPMFVFNLVESVGGHADLAAAVPALLEALRLPFTGARFKSMVSTSNKVLAKHMLAGAGMPTPAWGLPGDVQQDVNSGPWIVKPRWEDASIGINDGAVVRSAGELETAFRERGTMAHDSLFAERFIEGREFNVSLIARKGNVRTLPIAEILFADYPPEKPRILSYAAKWQPATFEYSHTVRSFEADPADRPLRGELGRLARRCWEIFQLSGYARVDFRIDESGRPWILEVNANPCLSPDAGLAASLSRADIAYEKAIGWIVEEALGYTRSPSYAVR